MQVHVFVILRLEESNMGFVQSLAKRVPGKKTPKPKRCYCKGVRPKNPKLTLRYIFNLKKGD